MLVMCLCTYMHVCVSHTVNSSQGCQILSAQSWALGSEASLLEKTVLLGKVWRMTQEETL